MNVIFLDFDGVITTVKSKYNLDKDSIALLGDDNDMLAYQIKHFVKTNSYIGLTKSDVKKAIRILNK